MRDIAFEFPHASDFGALADDLLPANHAADLSGRRLIYRTAIVFSRAIALLRPAQNPPGFQIDLIHLACEFEVFADRAVDGSRPFIQLTRRSQTCTVARLDFRRGGVWRDRWLSRPWFNQGSCIG
jgi:hypothetical protein